MVGILLILHHVFLNISSIRPILVTERILAYSRVAVTGVEADLIVEDLRLQFSLAVAESPGLLDAANGECVFSKTSPSGDEPILASQAYGKSFR